MKQDIKAAFWFFVWPFFLQWASKFVHISQRSLRKSFSLLILGIVYFAVRLMRNQKAGGLEPQGLNQAIPKEKRVKKKKEISEIDRISRHSRAKRKAANLKKERKRLE